MYSIREAVGTGSRITVAVPPYISKDHIRVYVDSIPEVNYEWVNDSTIALEAPNQAKVRVSRRTSPDERLTRYMNGEALPGEALEVDSKQAFFLAQEAYDLALSAGGTASGLPGTITIGGVEMTEEALLSVLQGKVSLALLDDTLKADVALISAGAQVPGSVAWLFAQEAASRESWAAQEQDTRVAGLVKEAQERASDMRKEAESRLALAGEMEAKVDALRSTTYALDADLRAGIATVENAMVEGDTALAERVTSLDASVKDENTKTLARIWEVTEALADRTEALTVQARKLSVAFKTTSGADSSAAITSLQQALANAQEALASQITALDAAYKTADTDLAAGITAVDSARATGDEALSERLNILDAAVQAADAALQATITEVSTARTDGDTALATRLDGMETSYKGADAELSNRAWELTEALVYKVESLLVTMRRMQASYKAADQTLQAAIYAADTARVNADAALAQQLTTVEATLTGQTTTLAAVQTDTTALATRVGTVEANYTLKVTAVRPDGKVVLGGIGVNASANNSSGQSEILLSADRLQFVDPNNPGGVPVPVLAAGIVNGAPTLVIPAARYGDQSVAGRVLVDGTVTANKIDSRGLTIRDGDGNIILGAGTGLDWSRVAGANRPADGATRNDFSKGVGAGELFNSHCTIEAPDGRPAGVRAMYGSALSNTVSYQDAAKTIVRLFSSTDASTGCAWDAFRVVPGTRYTVKIRVKSNVASASGLYFRIAELDTELTQGNTYVHNGTGEAGGQTFTRQAFLHENAAIGTEWGDITFTYTPTSTTRWASPFFLNWDGMGTSELHIAHVVVVSEATYGATLGVNVGGQINSSNVTTYIANAAITNAQFGGDLYSTNWGGYQGNTGWMLERGGNLIANSGTFRGDVKGGQFMTGAYTGYAWPAGGMGLGGSYLGPSGLLLGNAYDGKYFQVTSSGNMYAPGMKAENGVLTIDQANVINTVNIAGNAVTIPAGAFSAELIGPLGYQSWHIVQTVTVWSPGGVPFFVTGSMDATTAASGSTSSCLIGIGVNSGSPSIQIAGSGGVSVALTVYPPAGWSDLYLLAKPNGGVNSGRYTNRSLFAIGTKR